jgi:phospholipase C
MTTICFRGIALGLIATALCLSSCSSSSSTSTGKGSNPPTLVFSANTNSISSGQSVTLNWNATNAASVTITATAGSSARTLITSSKVVGSVTDSPSQTTTYSAVAAGDGGNTPAQSATVQVLQAVTPTITQFSATPSTVNSGQTTTLTWATQNATSVTITPSIPMPEDAITLPTSGSDVVPVSTTTVFSITATGPGGSVGPQSVTVLVPVVLALTASPNTIAPGQPSTLTWRVANGSPSSLSITDGAGAVVCNPCALPEGMTTVTPSSTSTYTATAVISTNNSITQSTTVTVSASKAGVIKHIFFMAQENRSFDNYFGQLGAYRAARLAQFGINDQRTVDGFDPNVTLTNAHTGAKVQPFHQATVCTNNTRPDWGESHHDVALVGGDSAWATTTNFTSSSFAMSGFLDSATIASITIDPNGTRAMGYYNEQDIPFYYDLATFFATSDTWYSPVLGNTVPNRLFLMAATSFGHQFPDGGGHPLYAAPTLFRAMNAANVSWIYYYKDSIFLSNFADFQDPAIQPKTFPVSDLMNRLAGTCSSGPCDPDKVLPEVIFIDSGAGASNTDEHPNPSVDLQRGAAYVQSIISALMASDAWKDSIFILTYDEGGGLYDHVPPVSVPLPDSYGPGQCPDPNNGSAGYCATSAVGGTFNLTGFRVPLIVASPYVKPNFVSHIPRDYTAILAYIENTFGVPPLTDRDAYWQDASRDMNEFFDFNTPALLNGPGGTPWAQILNSQTISGVCDATKEVGPTM